MKTQTRFFAAFIFIMAVILVGCASKDDQETPSMSIDVSIGSAKSVLSPNFVEYALEDDELECCISEAILAENKSVFKPIETETYATESHNILKKLKTGIL